MIAIKDLKVGDIVCAIYHEGKLGYHGNVCKVKITNITDEEIEAIYEDGRECRFHNDGKYGLIGLENSNFQFLNLFLGTVDEAEKFDNERVSNEELFVEAYNLFMREYRYLPADKLKKIIRLLK